MRGAPPAILIASGLEPAGRAGLLADVNAVHILGAHPIAIATALTAQGRRTFALEPAPAKLIAQQLRAARELGPIDAVKLGMIPNRAILEAIRGALPERVPLVVDPVVRTSRGEPLSRLHRRDYLALAARNVVITPNLAEAAWLLGFPHPPATASEACECAKALRDLGFGGVIVKGGHLDGAKVDVVMAHDGDTHLHPGAALKRSVLHRGTGCRYASALAVGLAQRRPLHVAAHRAKGLVENFLRAPILGPV